jgi:hypothetical protein
LRETCISYVKANGGKEFFKSEDWKNRLHQIAKTYRAKNILDVHYENELDQELAIRDSLIKAKDLIELELNKSCEHFAYPWNASGELSLLWLKELGFKTVFRFMHSWRFPGKGSDPFSLRRFEGYWIKSLPGKGRVGMRHKLEKRLRVFWA